MKKGKNLLLKKILALFFIITLLSNHMLIISEVADVALATEVKLESEFTSNVKNLTKPLKEENQIQENKIENSVIDNSIIENSIPENILPENTNFVDDENTTDVTEEGEKLEDEDKEQEDEEVVEDIKLTDEEIESLQKITANTELEVNKLVKFDNESGKGIITDITIKLNCDTKDYSVDDVTVNFELPSVSNVLPTMFKFNEKEDNVQFSKEEGTNNVSVNIKEFTKNKDEEINMLLVYPEEAFNAEEINVSGTVTMQILGYEFSGNFEETKELKETLESFANYSITLDTSSRYKGYLYANTVLENKKDFEYSSTDVVEIKDVDFIDEIIVENPVDKVVTNSREIDLVGEVSYKSTYIKIDEFEAVLGEEGYIEIYNQLGEKIGEINRNSEKKNDNYVFYYDIDVDNVYFKIKNIENNATLNIKNNKVIKGSETFSRDYIRNFTSIKTQTINKVIKKFGENEIIVQKINQENNINLEETESAITLEMSNTDFVTTEKNEITFTATLKTNEEKYELFRNPVIYIELPSAVENAEITNINLLYEKGLAIKSYEVVENTQGSKVIQVTLEGTQNQYKPGSVLDETTLVITADISLNRITANGKGFVRLRYTNEIGSYISYMKEEKESIDTEVNYVSRNGILKETKIENYNNSNDVLVTYENDSVVGKIEAEDSAKTATVSTIVMNNYNEEIKNVEIIGKIPFIGNKQENIDLNTTFNTTLIGPVTLNGLMGKVYYTSEENPDKNSTNWTETVSDFSTIKNFKVVLNNETMKVGEKVELSYNLNIPDNIGYNAKGYNVVTTYYDFNNQELEDSTIVGLETEVKEINPEEFEVVEQTPELTVSAQVTRGNKILKENEEINEGQILRYNVILTNTSDVPITNISLKGLAENSNSYYWYTYEDINSTTMEEDLVGYWKEDLEGEHIYETSTISSLNPGETAIFSYQVKVKHLNEISNQEVYGKILISADGIEEKEYQTFKNKIRNAEIEMFLTAAGPEKAEDKDTNLYTLNTYNFITSVKNISNRDLQNLKVNVALPKSMEISTLEMELYNELIEYSYQDIGNETLVTFIIPKLAKGETKELISVATISKMDLSISEKSITMVADASIDGKLYLSNDYTRKIVQSETSLNLTYTSTPENGAVVKNGDKVNYNIIIKNTGVTSGLVDFTDFLDTGFVVDSATITLPDGTIEKMDVSEYNYILKVYVLEPNEQLIVDVEGHIDSSEYNTNQTIIESKLSIDPPDNLNEYENIVFYIAPEEVSQLPEEGAPEDEEDTDNNNSDVEEENDSNDNNENENNNDDNNNVEPETPEENQDNENENVISDVPSEENNNDSNENNQTQNEEQKEENVANNKNNVQNEEKQNSEYNEQNVENQPIEITNNQSSNNIESEVKAITYSISGKAWLDEDKNGLYDNNEELLQGTSVMLFKGDNSENITDSSIVETTTTNDEGKYVFSNLKEGKYIVVFDYDNNKYEVSSYKTDTNSKASKVISKNLKINDNSKNYAVSNILEITTTNINDINLGLKENTDFDMDITTYVKRVVVENQKGTETQEFTEDDRLAKIEIHSKYLNSSKVTIEYAVKVTNRGKIDGYVNQIANCIAEGLDFNDESSINWKMSEDGTIYSSALNSQVIAPGESREVSFIVTKNMNEDSTGVYKNKASIISSTNDRKLSDSNEENNTSEVELLISVKTGAIYYVLVILIALTVIFIAMLIVSKLIKNDANKVNLINKIIIIISIIIIITLFFIIKAYSYNYIEFLNENVSNFCANNHTIGAKTYYATMDGWGDRRIQCCEGNITTPYGASDSAFGHLLSEVAISGKKYSTRSLAGNGSGNSDTAAKIAYMCYKVEAGSAGQGVFGYMINHHRSEIKSIMKVNVNGTITTGGNFASLWTQASSYAANLSSGGGAVSKSNNVSKLQYNGDVDGFGAILAKIPKSAKLYLTINGTEKEYKGKVLLANGTQKKLTECSGKAFYIPYSAVSTANDLEKVKIKIKAEEKTIIAKVMNCFHAGCSVGAGQNQAVMRGYEGKASSEISYTLDAIANVEVSKKVIKKSLSDGTNETSISSGDYVDRKDLVKFEITVNNKGAQAVTLDIQDSYNTNQYEFVSLTGGNKKTPQNGSWQETITAQKGETKFIMTLRVKENVSANASTQLLNSVKISNFKIGKNKMRNKKGNKEADSDYVRCKQYKITVNKTIESINSKAGAAKSTKDTVEVGDTIIYKIVIKNNGGKEQKSYGTIKCRVYEDVPSGFQCTEHSSWKSESGRYYYEKSFKSGETVELKITMKVTDELLNKEAVKKTNTVTITSAKNRNDVDLLNKYLINSKTSDTATVKILGYKLSITKVVDNINDGTVKDLTKCEIGDKITYKITVTNTGSNTTNYANIYNIVLEDIFKPNELKFLSANAPGWDRNNNTYTYKGPLKPGQSAVITLSMEVILESKQKVQIANTGTITSLKNKNDVLLKHLIPASSSVSVEYQTYDMGIWKYISNNNSTVITGRDKLKNQEKYNSPVEVEKYNYVDYTIKVQNTGTTIINNVSFLDTLDNGLTYKQTVSKNKFNSSGADDGTSSTITESINGNNLSYSYPGQILPGEYVIVVIRCEITMSNMYLLNLKNEINLTSVHNRNNIDLVQKDLVNYTNKEHQEYVRLKNLVLSGRVWIDKNKNGIIEDSENKLEGIEVILHDDTNKKIATTTTLADGTYTFGETNGKNENGTDGSKKMVEGGANSGRIIKATNRDDVTGNYTSTSQYINYYLEFYYNGVKYISTVYAGNDGKANINTSDNSISTTYMIDSNACEYSNERDALNNSLETIEYNKGMTGIQENGGNMVDLSYTKNKHNSTLDLTDATGISAYSFMLQNTTNNGQIINGNNINMLFFSQSGETEYLKYINLGLQTREMDLGISEDVYNLKTTVNGAEMTYIYNQANVKDSPFGGQYVTGGENNPMIYEFNLYASDYYYKHDQYKNEEVKNYKVNTELNVEITYKMTITNNDVKDTNDVYSVVREVADFYSTDFKEYNPNNNTEVVRVSDEKGFLKDNVLNKVEAWYYADKNGVKTRENVTLSNTPRYSKHAQVDLNNKYRAIYLTGFDDVVLKQGESFDIYIKFIVNTTDGTKASEILLDEKANIAEINAYSTYYSQNNKPAGFVDNNSNPGNLGVRTDASKSAGSENTNIEQYSEYENDSYKTGISLIVLNTLTPPGKRTPPGTPVVPPTTPKPEPKESLERVIKGSVWDDARSEDVSGQYTGNGEKKIGEDTKKENAKYNERIKSIVNEETDSIAKGIQVRLVELVRIPTEDGTGQKIYEESISTWSDAIVSTRTEAENGTYTLESFIPGNYVIRFNYGESEEDKIFNGQEYKSTKYYNASENSFSTVEPMGNSGDVVLEKLEEKSKSDARDDEIRRLEVTSYSEIMNNEKTVEVKEYTDNFMKNTNMFADTIPFPIRAEKTNYGKIEFSYDEYTKTINKNIKYQVENIDFGIEYRPESNIKLDKFLSRIQLTTSDGKVLADINFDPEYNDAKDKSRITGTVLSREKSIGEENLQYLPSVIPSPNTTDKVVKGLAYLNVDEDLLQGCTVDITYIFNVTNESEIDTISQRLYNLRYRLDAADSGYKDFLDEKDGDNYKAYTASGTAKNELTNEYYSKDNTYRVKDKLSFNVANGTGYYGKYLGQMYYTGSFNKNTDKVSELKIDKILDYVDTDMTFETSKNEAIDRYWRPMSQKDLNDYKLIDKNLLQKVRLLQDVKGIQFETDTKNNLAVSVDDRISAGDTENKNNLLSRFLVPNDSATNNLVSSGSISLVTSQVLAGEKDTESMTYDNSAEVIQYTTLTGRINKLQTTIGNLDVTDPDYEDDSSFTERVTLTPPTGLEKTKYYLSIIKDKIVVTIIIVIAVIVILVIKKKLQKVNFKKFYK